MSGSKKSIKKIPNDKCSTCRKPKPSGCRTKTCDACRKRAAVSRQNKRDNKIPCQAKKQDGKSCDSKVSPKCGNKFCEKHITEWKEYQETGGKQVRRCNSRTQCDPNKPGMKAILPDDYTKKKCENCLIKERQKEKILRNKKNNLSKKMENNKSEYRICRKCPIGKKHKINEMGLRTNGTRSNLCMHHFSSQQKIEANRPDRDQTEYYNSLEVKYRDVVKKCKKYGLELKMTIEEYEKLAKSSCYYCKFKKNNYLIGVDRLDNSKGYIEGNIVPCCKMCNFMKNTLNEATFILMCAHIAHYNKFFKTKLYPNIFNTYKNISYNNYEFGASKRKLDFCLTEEEFEKIISNSCYICGRVSTDQHRNGIDRYNNSKGYIFENCKTCCGDCNFLKKIFEYDKFIFQCAFIASEHKNRLDELENKWIKSNFGMKRKSKITDTENEIAQVNKNDIVEV